MEPTSDFSPAYLNYPPVLNLVCQSKQVNSQDYPIQDRLSRLPWWNQERMSHSSALVVGCGGLGSFLSLMLIQMGLAEITLIDDGLVEDSNRTRQLFTESDVGKPKAHQLAGNISRYAVGSTRVSGFFMPFERWLTDQRGMKKKFDLNIFGVDRVATNVTGARYSLVQRAPAITVNVSADGDAAKVFIQRTDASAPCYLCSRPGALNEPDRPEPCAPVAAIADVLHVACGLAIRAAVNELLRADLVDWNCRQLTLSGLDIRQNLQRRPECPLCRDLKEPMHESA